LESKSTENRFQSTLETRNGYHALNTAFEQAVGTSESNLEKESDIGKSF
jgi:hypothetical protein